MINNQNILDQNVNTLKRQFNDATDYLKKAQTKADTLKNQLNNATVLYSLAKNTFEQAKSKKQAADDAVNRIVIGNTNNNNTTNTSNTLQITNKSNNASSILLQNTM